MEIPCGDWLGLQPAVAASDSPGRTTPAAAVGPVDPVLTAFGPGQNWSGKPIPTGARGFRGHAGRARLGDQHGSIQQDQTGRMIPGSSTADDGGGRPDWIQWREQGVAAGRGGTPTGGVRAV
ncbi:hypothetical protein Aspvir_007862 [Aspergillus viridinutans]|uniref:Uncharacterized protein n=1 Tax=Aspergillus viridinutans TaxID=75553 RepID=A0A9P3BWH7_ASPVI|nr:uncharacterized protein Aspvir_007862 [Aspergillus viridinutans]GIK03788.1 hypothetical protein Aspvir_007862 [Aspergillus viridinutans]